MTYSCCTFTWLIVHQEGLPGCDHKKYCFCNSVGFLEDIWKVAWKSLCTVQACIHVHIYICMCACTNTATMTCFCLLLIVPHTHTCAYTHTHMRAHTHTHARTHSSVWLLFVGPEVKMILSQSGLSQSLLAQIWWVYRHCHYSRSCIQVSYYMGWYCPSVCLFINWEWKCHRNFKFGGNIPSLSI